MKPLSLQKFSLLLLATLAKNSDYAFVGKNNKNQKFACLPVNFKQNIENLLCESEGWQEEFSCLIDMEKYFENHFDWERELSIALKKTIKDANKKIEYSFQTDSILVAFDKEEIDLILKSFKSENVKDTMSHFSKLLVDYTYTREYKEKYYNKDEKAIQYMRDLDKKRNADLYDYGY